MYMSYDLSHYLEGDISQSTSFTVSDDDAINCAHMLAAGFNTISRKMMGDFVLAVVDTKAGTVQYDGKIEQIDRPDPKHEDFESLALETVSIGPECFASTSGSLICWRGRNYIPQDEYEAHMRERNEQIDELHKRDKFEHYARSSMERKHFEQNDAARAELIDHVKRAYAKWGEVDPGRQRESLKAHLRGMLEVLSKYLVAIGEADADERHAAALRVCEIPEGNYLYDES